MIFLRDSQCALPAGVRLQGIALNIFAPRAMALAIEAGRAAFLADPMPARDMAAPSTPVIGRAFLA